MTIKMGIVSWRQGTEVRGRWREQIERHLYLLYVEPQKEKKKRRRSNHTRRND
jgi:hypothetical protein